MDTRPPHKGDQPLEAPAIGCRQQRPASDPPRWPPAGARLTPHRLRRYPTFDKVCDYHLQCLLYYTYCTQCAGSKQRAGRVWPCMLEPGPTKVDQGMQRSPSLTSLPQRSANSTMQNSNPQRDQDHATCDQPVQPILMKGCTTNQVISRPPMLDDTTLCDQ